ncbi:MAG: hypothetical protein JWN95_346 [Frankiales bacterium]|nr:hypothetical protein [Frankiales bacterium]
MKAIAGGGLLIAAALFIVSATAGGGHSGWAYLQAASEAAMVGGLADWFAVTALFRRPLGLPIPHTAIIPRKKDQIGASLGDFVQQNFLTREVVAPRVAAARIPYRVGDWLAAPGRSEQLSAELATALTGAQTVLGDDEIRAALERFVDDQLHRLPAAPLLAKVIDLVVEGGQHQILLGHGLRAAMRFLEDNRDLFRQRVSQESPDWVPNWVDERLFTKMFVGVQNFLADVVADEDHPLRREFDQRLRDYALRLRQDPTAAAAVDRFKNDLLDHPAVRGAIGSLWAPLKETVLAAAANPDSELRRVVASVVRQVGTTLRDDPILQAKCDRWVSGVMDHVLAHYSDEITGVITQTVARWDAESTSRRLELQVGRDLQFIRINGTVVGAIVGLIIFSVGRVL